MSKGSVPDAAHAGSESFRLRPMRRKWFWRAAWEVPLLILAWAAVRYWRMPPGVEPISLGVRVIEPREGQLRIEWNHAAKPLMNVAWGKIDIIDGVERQSITLTPAMLAAGSYRYQRETEDIEVRLTIVDNWGNQVGEASRFLGQPLDRVPRSVDLIDLQKRRDDLEAEVRRLREDNDAQLAQIQTLNRRLWIVKTKLGIYQGK